MQPPDSRPTERFSRRVDDYVRYRPTYPAAVLEYLQRVGAIDGDSVIADIGCGTGISSRLFLENGNTVIGVEPNAKMRSAAIIQLSAFPNFRAVSGKAEATGLQNESVDFIIAGQAFHWFDVPSTRAEWKRILRLAGHVALMWNVRRVASTPFLTELESLLLRLGTDYQRVRHERVDPEKVAEFFGGDYQSSSFYNFQDLDWPGLRGRMLSSSYFPMVEDSGSDRAMDELRAIFDQHQVNDRIRIDYDTELHTGALA